MSLNINTHAFGATRSFSRPERGVLEVEFQRLLPSGRAVTGGATLTRNADQSVTVQVSRTGPNGREGERTATYSADQVDAFKDALRERITDHRDGPDTSNQ